MRLLAHIIFIISFVFAVSADTPTISPQLSWVINPDGKTVTMTDYTQYQLNSEEIQKNIKMFSDSILRQQNSCADTLAIMQNKKKQLEDALKDLNKAGK